MPIAGFSSESDIGLWQSISAVMPARARVVPDRQAKSAIVPAITAVVPAVTPATAVVPARQTRAAVVPTAAVVVPPGQLLLAVDLHERAALLGSLCGGIRDGLADRLQALGHFGGLVRRRARGQGRRRVRRGKADGKAQRPRRKQRGQGANRTAVLGHVLSPPRGESTLARRPTRPQMKRASQLGSMPVLAPPFSRS